MHQTETEIIDKLQVSRKQVRACLKRLVNDGVLDKLARPVKYRSKNPVGDLLQLTELNSTAVGDLHKSSSTDVAARAGVPAARRPSQAVRRRDGRG